MSCEIDFLKAIEQKCKIFGVTYLDSMTCSQ